MTLYSYKHLSLAQILARRDWENPATIEFNRLPSHTQLNYWQEHDAAKQDIPSDNIRSLNGKWKFNYFTNPEAVPSEWVEHDLADANNIDVPLKWHS